MLASIHFVETHRRNLRLWSSLAAIAAACLPAAAGAKTISTAETDKVSLSGNDSLLVTGTGSLSTGGDKAVSIKTPTAITVTVDSGGSITSEDDAINAKSVTSGNGTVSIVNNGTITSTVSGQAIDLNDVDASGVTTTITNGGTISSTDGDGVRPGAHATVVNSGTIYSDGPVGENSDGVDLQSHAGTIVNEAGGLISGKRHGITSDVDVNVTNYGTIIGRNGSGVGSDDSGTVLNYGTIIGAYDGSGNGDGDGIDIDNTFSIDNYGTIEATGAGGSDADGAVHRSEGIAMTGNGTLINEAGASITSVNAALVVAGADDLTITNYGTVHATITGLLPEGRATFSLYNYGTLSSDYVAVADLNDRNDVYISNQGEINGKIYGILANAVSDRFRIDNAGTISGGVAAIYVGTTTTFDIAGTQDSLLDGGLINHGTTTVTGGTIAGAVTNDGALTLGTGNTATGDVTNSGGTLTLDGDVIGGRLVMKDGALTVAAAGASAGSLEGAGNGTLDGALTLTAADGTYSGALAGTGGLTLASGTQTLTGVNTYTGATTVHGSLVVGGSIAGSAVTVGGGGTLSGTGTVGATRVQQGGTLAPGGDSAIGSITVNGNLVMEAGSTLSAAGSGTATGQTVTVGGRSYQLLSGDHVQVAGAAQLGGGAVAFNGALEYGQAYDLLTAAGGVGGTFGELTGAVDSEYLFLSPELLYSGSDVYLTLERNAVSFASVADSANGRAAGLALDGLTLTSPVAAAAAQLDATGARTAFDALSGEIHASVLTAMTEDSAYYRQAALNRLAVSGCDFATGTTCGKAGTVLWGEAYGNDAHNAGDGNAARLNHSLVGFLVGIDTPLSATWRVGGLVAYGRSKFDVGAGRDSSGHSDKLTLGAYAGGGWGALRLRIGGSYSRDSLSVSRTVAFDGFDDSLSSRYHGHTLQAFGELGYVLGGAGWTVEPFAGLAYVDTHTNAFAERGGDAALNGKAASENATLSTLGLRGHAPLSTGSLPVTLDATLGWRHLFGSRSPWIDTAFATGGPDMAIGGAPLARDAATVDAGLTLRLSGQASLSLAYTGQFGKGVGSNGGRAQLRIGF